MEENKKEKERTWFYILISLMIVFVSCTQESTTDPNAVFTEIAQTVLVDMTQTAISDPNAIHTQVAGTMMAQAINNSQDEPTEVPATAVGEIGDRSNPVPINQPLNLIYDDIAQLQIVVREIIRGDQAWNMVYQTNQFNDPPAAGMEYLVAKIGVIYLASSQPDFTLSIDGFYFKSVSNNQILDQTILVNPEPELNANLFPGGSSEGYIVVSAYLDDPAPLIIFEDWLDFSSTLFYFSASQ
ncbi:hypothetical protein KJ564_08750 [bacterium]|nr:hypothetical protein [bacterium]